MRGFGWLSLCLLLLTPASFAAGSLPGCDSPVEVRATIDDVFNSKSLWKMPYAEHVKVRSGIYERLVKKYPREWEPNRRLIRASLGWGPGYGVEVRERYLKQAAENPDDPLALELAGFALFRVNTPEAIRKQEAALDKADFPWPHLDLAEIYSTGKFADPKKASEHLRAYFRACPDSLHDTAHSALSRSQDRQLQAEITAAIRARLEKDTRPPRAQDWQRLWGLEFRSHPPQEHAALRKRVAEDLKILEARKTSPDDRWLLFLRDGYKQAGASGESVRVLEDRIVERSPHSEEAFRIAMRRRFETVKPPADPKDAAAWAAFRSEFRKTIAEWKQRFTEVDPRMLTQMYLQATLDDESSTEKEVAAALDEFVKFSDPFSGDYFSYASVTSPMLDRRMFPDRALEMMKTAMRRYREEQSQAVPDDTLTDSQRVQQEEWPVRNRLYIHGVLLRAVSMAGKVEDVVPYRAEIEGPAPKKPDLAWLHWQNRARLAKVEGRKADALAYYQTALRTRKDEPRPQGGRLRDDLTDEAKSLWKELGGTESAWAQWSRPASPERKELTGGRWEQPTKPLSAFELPDLNGKVWRLRSLEGKTLFINVWATWCGPCLSELPKLQTLYEQTKERKDLQILAFNVDEGLGMVAPFLKEKGYTFPVVAAYEFVSANVDYLAVPQNWLVDPKGAWRWTQMGFDAAEPDWTEAMLKKLESLAQP